jgi:alkanesulfonate monooxygenase SsuD/methylene tetrahydromethanopterin reductase-like flavin-dependent oxidoreductase (luciferase family)
MQAPRTFRFHWSPYPGGPAPSVPEFIALCREAERAGAESIHVPVTAPLSDALALATAAGTETTRIRFRIGWSFGDILKSLYGRDLLQAAQSLRGRLIIHTVFLQPQHEFDSAREFIANCRALFPESEAPAFDIEGETAEAAFLAIQHGDCLWRLPHRPRQVQADALPVLHFGKEAGLVSFVIARETRDQALEAAATLFAECAAGEVDDATHWITPSLWSATVPSWNRKVAALIGSFEEVAAAIRAFGTIGVSHFLVREWSAQPEIACFAARIVPLVRALETSGGAG